MGTGPRLHQVGLRGQDDRRRCVEETQDEGLRLQPGVRRQLLSANDPVHQPQRLYGPFSKKADVYLPHSAEVTSAKYTNMRYNDKSSAKHNLDQFLVDAHKTQIKELNGTTAMARVNLMKNIVTSRRQPHTPLDNVNTPYNPIRLLKGAPPGQEAVNHYISELSI